MEMELKNIVTQENLWLQSLQHHTFDQALLCN
jgi:hypothetical protein